MSFGKYKNKSYEYIYDLEPSYIKWLLNKDWFQINHKDNYNYCINIIKNHKINYNKNFIVYTDGSCPNNGTINAIGKIGVHFSCKNKIKLNDISEILNINMITNNLTELLAIKKAMLVTKNIKNVKIYTDSKYSINVITKWYDKWIENGLLKTKKNIDIIEPICKLYKNVNVELIHIRAHTGKRDEHSIGNMIADRLANIPLK